MSNSEDQSPISMASVRNDRRNIYMPAEDDSFLSSSISENLSSLAAIYTPESESHYNNGIGIYKTDNEPNNSTYENDIGEPGENINQLQRINSNLTIQSDFAFPDEDDYSDIEIEG